MATTSQIAVVNSSSWNLPANTSNTVETTTATSRSGDDRVRNVQSVTTTVRSSTSESVISKAYSYKTTGTSYTTSSVGEEIVNTETSAIQLLAQPYMKAGDNVKVIGEDFAPNTEIRLYLDEIVMAPVVGLNNYTKQYTRPWMWSWCYDYDSTLWKFYCPYTSDVYYYDDENDVWKVGNSTTSATTTLSWANRITRTPWIINAISKLDANSTEKTRWIAANQTDSDEDYSKSKSTIITDEDGYFEAYIAIPENTATGTHNIVAETVLPAYEDTDKYRSASSTITGESYFRHSDTVIQKRQVLNETVYRDVYVTETWQKYAEVDTTVTTTTGTVVDYGYYDPVAQTFKVSTDQFLVGVDVYFSGAVPSDDTKKPWIAIREVVDGVPSETLMYAADIDKSTINNADNYIETVDSSGTVYKKRRPTYIPFDYPIYVSSEKTYAFTLGCNEDGYKVYYSQIGNKDVLDGTAVVYQKQQSESGVMMTSSNNSVWSPIQEADLTYSLYSAVFATGSDNKRTIFVKDIKTNMDYFSSLNVSIGNTTFENTGIDVYYAITTGANNDDETISDLMGYDWKPMSLETLTTFSALSEYKNGMNLKLRFDLWTLDSNVTPVVNFDTLEIFVGKFKDEGTYIQNIIELQ